MVYFSNVTSDYTVRIMKNKPNKWIDYFLIHMPFSLLGRVLGVTGVRTRFLIMYNKYLLRAMAFVIIAFIPFLDATPARAQFMPEDPETRNIMVYETIKDPAHPDRSIEQARWPWTRLQIYYDIIMRQSILPTALPGQEKLFIAAPYRLMIIEKSSLGNDLRQMTLAARQVQIRQYRYVYTDYYNVQKMADYLDALMKTPRPKDDPPYGLVRIVSSAPDNTKETTRLFSSARLIDDLALMLAKTTKLVPDHDRPPPPDRRNEDFNYVITIDSVVDNLPYQIMVSPHIVRVITRTSDERLYGDRMGIDKITLAEKAYYEREIQIHRLPPRQSY